MRTEGCLNQVNVYSICSKGSRLVQGEACCRRGKYDVCVTVAQSAAWAGYDTAGNLKKKKESQVSVAAQAAERDRGNGTWRRK